jgi:hypothetical protein
MEVYWPTRRLLAESYRWPLLLAALTTAIAATLLSPNLIAPEPHSMSAAIVPAKPIALAVVSGASTRHANPNQTKSMQKPDQRKALFLYLLHGLAGHPLGLLK